MSEMLKIKAILGGWGRIVSCPLRVDQVQIIFLVFHSIQIQMRNTSWHPHAWFLSKKAAVPVFNPLFSVPNPVFWLYLCFQSRFSSFCFLFPIHVFCLISVPHPGFLVFCVHLCFRLIFFGLISVPNSGFLVFWIHLFSRFPIHISAAQSTAILRLITWVFKQKIRNYIKCRLQNIGTTWYIRLRDGWTFARLCASSSSSRSSGMLPLSTW